eukprot:TRINITY_DN9160_c0_g1_i1.p1 TRINITY_DN9160_c0_g1~~TRINITY_DN9160_c0_g1_i1.p1  ORF type:complete len:489 (+),score=202.29 TRINITY_DN9160_c0_g1_i1:291-1757(+)
MAKRLGRLSYLQAVLAALQIAVCVVALVMAVLTKKANDRLQIRNVFSGCVGILSGAIGLTGGITKKELATRMFFVFQLWMLSTTTMYLYVGVDKEGYQVTTCAPLRSFSDSSNSEDCSDGLAYNRTKLSVACVGLVLALLSCLVSFDFEDALDDWSDKQKAMRLATELSAADRTYLYCPIGTSLSDNGVSLQPAGSDERTPLAVAAVRLDSAADTAGIEEWMVLCEVDGNPIHTRGELENALAAPAGPSGHHVVVFKKQKRKRDEEVFSADSVADALHKAMKGLGTDERAVYRNLQKVTSQNQWWDVMDAFEERHPRFCKGDLRAALVDELSDKELDWALAILETSGIDPYKPRMEEEEPAAVSPPQPPIATPVPTSPPAPVSTSPPAPVATAPVATAPVATAPDADAEEEDEGAASAPSPPPQPASGRASPSAARRVSISAAAAGLSPAAGPSVVEGAGGRRVLDVPVEDDEGDSDTGSAEAASARD